MSAKIVIWSGPVNLSQVKGATVPGARAYALPCTGNGDPSCVEIADDFADAEGRRLPHLFQQMGISNQNEDLIFGAFSAGGSMVKRLLLHEADRQQVRAVLLADATYTDWVTPAQPLAPEGFVLFCLDAIVDRKLFVATASSSPNKSLPTGSQTLAAIRKEVERRSGREFASFVLPGGIEPAPAEAWRLGNVILADFKSKITHTEHATKLAAPMWQRFLLPWLAEEFGEMPNPNSAPTPLIAGIQELIAGKGVYGRQKPPHSAATRRIQEALVFIGFDLVPDGAFGPKTEAAVRAFQTWGKIKVDGIVGPGTLNALLRALESGARVNP
jgi:hypothetical protein